MVTGHLVTPEEDASLLTYLTRSHGLRGQVPGRTGGAAGTAWAPRSSPPLPPPRWCSFLPLLLNSGGAVTAHFYQRPLSPLTCEPLEDRNCVLVPPVRPHSQPRDWLMVGASPNAAPVNQEGKLSWACLVLRAAGERAACPLSTQSLL